MSYQVFARKYRPQNFDAVVGQEHITQTLKNAIGQNRLAHAYLFVGPRGTGKTSTARILAKALNCVKGPTIHPCGECDACREISQGNSLDVLEIDGASNNGVEQVRDLRDNVRYAPTHGKYKIYIIDEVHMLTSAAFNALLKTLEEPPAHVKFIFATTEPQKVLPTILSRCQRFDLRRIPAHLIAKHLQYIAKQEKIALDDAAANAIAKGAEGGLRDAESMLDQLVAFCGDKISEQDVLLIFGFTAQETVSTLCGHILEGATPQALAMVHEQAEAGKDLSRLMSDLISHLRDLLVTKADPDGVMEELGEQTLAELKSQSEKIPMDRLLELIEQFAAAETRMKWAPNKKLHFEIAVIKAIQTLGQTTLNEIIDTLAALRGGGEAAAISPDIRRGNATASSAVPSKRLTLEAAPPLAPEPISTCVVKEESPGIAQVADENLWPSFLAEIRARRQLISSWIEAGTFIGIDGNVCRIGFPKDQASAMDMLASANNRKFLEELLTTLAGRPLTLQCELRDDLVIAPPILPEKKNESVADPMEEFKNDPLIQKALEIFKTEIQPA